MTRSDEDLLDRMFRSARTHNAWQDRPVSEALLRQAWDLARMGPTSANCSPLRIVFVQGREAKERRRPCLSGGNVDKTMAAPVTAILAQDMVFFEKLDQLFPHDPTAPSWFAGKPDVIADAAFRNSSLQAAYFLLALRAVGLDCGPMSGFDAAKVEAAFLEGTGWRANFLCNIGYGDPAGLFPRSPRFDFDAVARIV
jgi:3-hydroxypropanoate dehydrogenase